MDLASKAYDTDANWITAKHLKQHPQSLLTTPIPARVEANIVSYPILQ